MPSPRSNAQEEQPQRIGGVARFFLRLVLPHAYGVMLQHRTIGTGETEERRQYFVPLDHPGSVAEVSVGDLRSEGVMK